MQKMLKTDINYIGKMKEGIQRMKPKTKDSGDSKKDINLLYFNQDEVKTINKKKIIGVGILLVIICLILVIYLVYAANENFRAFMDANILNKSIEQDNLKSITLENYDNSNIFAYSKYIAILKDNTLTTYNSSGKIEAENNIQITNPITTSNGKYLIIAEQDSSKIYLLKDNNIRWEKTLEGNISRISVNSSGYSAIILKGTAYKSVVLLLDDSGNEMFKYYMSSTIAVDASISEDNKYVGIAEVNTSGTLIQSNIKILSIAKAKENPTEAIVYTYNAPLNSLVLNIKYQNKNKLVCEYDNEIHVIKDNVDTKLTDINTDQEKITYYSIELDNNIVKNVEENASLFATNTAIKIINSTTQKENTYKFEGVIKEMYCCGSKIALNLGSEIHFVDTNGWLIKKYTSNQEVRKIVISNEVAGIIYRNKIELIKL
ncbi:MAG: hypothetical protein KHW52_07720 [Clostridium sp.]|nr:hypothetical protein [Clostridium sp.]PWM82887.1 MAG: hypothetical protein DBY41_01305 [Clostridium sp.]